MKEEDLIVTHNGKPLYRINEMLLMRQKCVENLKSIIIQHQLKLQIYDWIREEIDPAILHTYASWITAIEFTLQELWNFPKDINYHRFWDTPACQCPKMDCADNYPTGYYYIAQSCPLHGN